MGKSKFMHSKIKFNDEFSSDLDSEVVLIPIHDNVYQDNLYGTTKKSKSKHHNDGPILFRVLNIRRKNHGR